MSRTRGKALKVVVIIVAVLALLLGAAEVGVRYLVTSQIRKAMSDSGASSASVSMGSEPVILGLATGKIPHIKVDVPSTLNISYPDGSSGSPKVSGIPGVTLEVDGLGVTTQKADRLQMDALIPSDYILAVAQGGMNSDSMKESTGGAASGLAARLGSAIQITNIQPNPSQGLLTFEISGGIATFTMKPNVTDGVLSMKVDSATLLGMKIPSHVLGKIGDAVSSASTKTSSSLKVSSCTVTARGLHIVQEGTDVDMQEMSKAGKELTDSLNEKANQAGAASQAA